MHSLFSNSMFKHKSIFFIIDYQGTNCSNSGQENSCMYGCIPTTSDGSSGYCGEQGTVLEGQLCMLDQDCLSGLFVCS